MCKAWNDIANAKGVGPVSLSVYSDYQEDTEVAVSYILERLGKCATGHLRSVEVKYSGILGDLDKLYQATAKVLAMQSPLCRKAKFNMDWLADWSVLEALPSTQLLAPAKL